MGSNDIIINYNCEVAFVTNIFNSWSDIIFHVTNLLSF